MALELDRSVVERVGRCNAFGWPRRRERACGGLGDGRQGADLAYGKDREDGDRVQGEGKPQRRFGPDGRCD
jgi:hypothetical protein